jgi:autotransporter-associated beta strand protein
MKSIAMILNRSITFGCRVARWRAIAIFLSLLAWLTGWARAETFEVIALPDTQYYCNSTSYYPNFVNQANWIVANQGSENIVFVSHMGDVVQDPSVASQWDRGVAAMNIISGSLPNLPYSVSMGNHDHKTLFGLVEYGTDAFTSRFGLSRYAGNSWYPTSANNGYNGYNHYQIFSTADYGQILNINLRETPAAGDLTWAQNVINAYPHIPTILSTHDYLTYGGSKSAAGTSIWNGLVYNNSQIFLVLCGHDYGSGSTPGTAHVVDVNQAGENVVQVLSDFQNMSQGGLGYLRKIIFNTGANGVGSVLFQTYSPTQGFRAGDEFSYTASFGSLIHNGLPLSKVWKGGDDNQWNLDASNLDWVPSAPSPGCYVQDATVRFDDTALNRTVNVTANVTPFSLTVDNSSGHDFSINSSLDGLGGAIGGRGSLIKQGTGKLTLTGVNSFTGGTSLLAGTIAIASSTSLGAESGGLTIGAGTLESTANMTAARPIVLNDAASTIQVDNDVVFSQQGAISGPGELHKTGGGALEITVAPTYQGNTTVSSGTLKYNISMGGGSPAVAATATLTISGTGSSVIAGGYVDPFTDGVDPGKHVSIRNDATLEILSGLKIVGVLDGIGFTTIDPGASLSAGRIFQDALLFSGDSIATIRPFSDGSGSGSLLDCLPSGASSQVPEPSTLAMLAMVALGSLPFYFRKQPLS